MFVRRAAFALVVIMAFVAGILWEKQMDRSSRPPQAAATPEPTDASSAPEMPPGQVVSEPSSDLESGLAWTVPKRWVSLGERPMRLATYSTPAASGDPEGGECAVFYFGPSQGGGPEANIERWLGQFENAGPPQRTTRTINGFTVHRVQVSGDYLAPSGPMMQSAGTKKGYMLIGAIVEGPAGGVFFKLTGPESTVKAASGDFDHMLASLKKG